MPRGASGGTRAARLDAGSVSHEEAETKALAEYEKFWRIQDKTVRSDFDKLIEGLE